MYPKIATSMSILAINSVKYSSVIHEGASR